MRKYLLGSKGFFFKANLHLHTTVSDGEWSPQQAKEEYKRKGYSIIAFTDHEIMVPHHDLTDQNFLALTAFEFAINENIPNATFPFIKTYHLNFYAKKREMTINPFFNERHLWIKQSLLYVNDEMRNINYGPKLYTEECINDIIRKANEQGFLASLNHLVWSQQNYTDYINLKGLWGIEVYNTCCARMGYVDTEQPYDDLLKRNNQIYPIASDDTHRVEHAFGGFTMIEAENLNYENVIKAMEEGAFYSSNGPLIHEITFENNKLFMYCSEVSQITLRTERRYAKTINGNNITKAEFDLTEYFEMNRIYTNRFPLFFRVIITDKIGKQAWTRAYFMEELF